MRRLIGIVLRWFIPVIACFGLGVASAPAQTYPVKPIRLIFGYTAGGAGDVGARLLAQKLSENLGQNVVVENRPGAGGAIADELVAKSPADGYTLLYAAGSTTILPALRPKLPYSVERDFAPVSMVMITSFALAVHPSVPVNDVKGLIALARSQPGKLTFSTPGVGSSSHFAGEVFKMMADVKMLHVPYRGAPEATTAVIAGEVDINFPSVTGALPFVKTGRLKALAVSSAKRAPTLPSVPTLSESGLTGYERAGWNGVLAPAGVPKEIIARLNAAIIKAVNTPEMKEAIVKQGLVAQTGTPGEFAAFIRDQLAQNAKVVKFAGIKTE
ncbi:MAG: tripartite tricarboxylate transporter substrate binding protein [Betaproteobacteria bacterium]|nr:tripartite tricarboxylate transporter substrate binding protein [Betaproteobacteria bacterium]MBI3052481.1 tripartite tricarboxylate transporter substrate binding protein [Betaproteobacteria bacterium]